MLKERLECSPLAAAWRALQSPHGDAGGRGTLAAYS